MSIASNFPAIKPSLNLDFANTKMLDSRVTFTRASTGTYYNGVTTAKAEENLVTYSQEFDNAAWVKSGATITANTTAAPDGTTTADTLTGNGVLGSHTILQTQAASAAGKTFSVYLKAGTNNFAQIWFDADAAPFADFDLSTGSLGSTGSSVTATITSAGGGWYRCVVYTSSSLATNPRIGLVTSSTAARSESNTLSTDIYLWGAQAENRSTVTAYTATTTQAITNYVPVLLTAQSGVPRFDHNPTTDESLGFLIEESRTNLLTYSEQFDNAAWVKTNATITANTVVAPDGTLTGDKLSENSASGVEHFIEQTCSTATNQTYTQSVYVKAAETATFRIMVVAVGSTNTTSEGVFTVSSGVISYSSGTNLISSGSANPVGNGWYRCTVVYTLNGTVTSHRMRIYPRISGFYTGDGYSGIYIWGAQLEAGAFATSYIQTVAATVTRAADAASMTGTNFSSWFSAAECTLFSEWDQSSVATGNEPYQLQFSDGTSNNRIVLFATSTTAQLFVGVGGVAQAFIGRTTLTANQTLKAAARVKTNDFALVLNGGAAATDTSGTVPTVTQFALGQDALVAGTKLLNGHLRRVAYYPMALSTANLQALTS